MAERNETTPARTQPLRHTRRSFLQRAGMLGLGTLAVPLLPFGRAEAVLFGRKRYKISETRLAMGTFVAMTAIHSSRDRTQEAFGAAFEEITRLSRLLSRHDTSSPVYELNRTGRLATAPVEVRDVVSHSLDFYRETQGAFDITVKPLIDLYQSCFAEGRQPREREITAVLHAVDCSSVRLRGNAVSLDKDGMGITLDGIAKGYVVDRASAVLAGFGIDDHLINAGGDIKVSGAAAGGRKWSIAIQDPEKKREFPEVIGMTAGAVATSGNYEAYYDREKLFHHIVDGHSGHSPTQLSSVTVLARTVEEADALSTSVFIYPPERGVALVESRQDCRCFLIGRDGRVHTSSGWPG